MTPLTITEPTNAYLWIIKPLIKAHVGNNADIYCGTIEMRAGHKLTSDNREGSHCDRNHTFLIVHQQQHFKCM